MLSVSTVPAATADAALEQLTLSITPTNGGSGTQVTLLCESTGGDHPDAAAACRDLVAAGGNIAAIPSETGVACPLFFKPVNAQAKGWWEGRPVSYSRTFPNTCFANIQTGGHVFNF